MIGNHSAKYPSLQTCTELISNTQRALRKRRRIAQLRGIAASQLSAGVLASSEALEVALNTQFKADGLETTVSVQAIDDAPKVDGVSNEVDGQGGSADYLIAIVILVPAVLMLLLVVLLRRVVLLHRRAQTPALGVQLTTRHGGATEQSAEAIVAKESSHDVTDVDSVNVALY